MHNEQIIHEINKKKKENSQALCGKENKYHLESKFLLQLCFTLSVFLCYTHLTGEQQAARSMESSSIINLRLDCVCAPFIKQQTAG